ncbi:MAG: HAD-IC family P-type ATPase, partial [Oscillospiraceae bacterium]
MNHSKNIDVLKDELKTNFSNGLSSKEASNRLEKYGKNVLVGKKPDSLIKKFFLQLSDTMVIILIIAAIISAVVTVLEGHNEFFEPAIILAIVIINAIMGVAQESKAQKALEALQNMSAPTAKVIRDGKTHIIDSKDVCIGDIISLEAGDFIPADGRLIESFSLKSEESALTGESVASEKYCDATVLPDAPIGDRTNMVFSGCSVTYGRGKAVITSTGMKTEMGRIASLLNNEKEQLTPLQQKLAKLGKYLGFICIGICAVIFVYGMFAPHMFEGMDLSLGEKMFRLFMTSVSLAVAAIPEGLPAVVTIVLAMGVSKMAKRNAIIKKLPAVETLGGANVICSDKTGTLTQNKMTVKKVYSFNDDKIYNEEELSLEEPKNMLITTLLASDGEVNLDENGKEKHIGDPTETAIVSIVKKFGIEKPELVSKYNRVGEIPFDSDRKLMTTISKIDEKYVVITKGAFDVIASICLNKDLSKALQ